jgi:hypothetical protein
MISGCKIFKWQNNLHFILQKHSNLPFKKKAWGTKMRFWLKLKSHVLFNVSNYKDFFFNVQWTFCHWNVDHVSCCLNGCKSCQYCISDKIAKRNVEKYMDEFKSWCNLLNIHAYIDDTHIETLNHIVFF